MNISVCTFWSSYYLSRIHFSLVKFSYCYLSYGTQQVLATLPVACPIRFIDAFLIHFLFIYTVNKHLLSILCASHWTRLWGN